MEKERPTFPELGEEDSWWPFLLGLSLLLLLLLGFGNIAQVVCYQSLCARAITIVKMRKKEREKQIKM